MTNKLREEWLMEAVEQIRPIFERVGYQIPPVKVSIGFPSTGSKGRHLGQCWSTKSSEDGLNQIFLAPHLETPVEYLDTLVHELVHAVDNCSSRHGAGFKKIAKDVGLTGPMRSAGAGEILMKDLVWISGLLGNFSHGKLNIRRSVSNAGIKRPGAKCSKCGYEIVMFKKYLEIGAPICPKDIQAMEQTGEWDNHIS